MPSFDSFNNQSTSISYPFPAEVNGVERIALSATGNLQRVLSAFFARPISIQLVYSQASRHTSPGSSLEPISQITPAIIAAASPETPIIQTRQVHLQCNGRIVCTATSTVRITSPQTAHLFLVEKYAIGQMFRVLEKVPAFELLRVGLGAVRDNEKGGFQIAEEDRNSSQLWRTYTLIVPHFECEILEVFPHREMFLGAERWLTGNSGTGFVPELAVATKPSSGFTLRQTLQFVMATGLLLVFFFEVSLFFRGQSSNC